MYFLTSLTAFFLTLAAVFSSPISDTGLIERHLPASVCKEVVIIVNVLKLYKATPFCSSFLHISTATTTSVVTTTSTTQLTTGTTTTSYVFLPGNPPAPSAKHRRSVELEAPEEEKRNLEGLPSYIAAFASSAISKACSCLSLPTPTTTVTSTSTTVITQTVPAPPKFSTIYPCADPLPSPGPAYGDAPDPFPPTIPGSENSLYYLDTPEGASAQGCCNACFFEIANCIQAYWYSYEGCVVRRGTGVMGTGQGVTNSCPNGVISGLVYGPDVNPAFRSSGNIVGPCGSAYNNV
ncbi:hypothetical protein MMC30_001859 [Trapelia coarctata]|nr:hypothetical protein [Trapelia coarctata]